jgi:hypothetical protein
MLPAGPGYATAQRSRFAIEVLQPDEQVSGSALSSVTWTPTLR